MIRIKTKLSMPTRFPEILSSHETKTWENIYFWLNTC